MAPSCAGSSAIAGLEGLAAAEALSRLYAASRLFVNFFQPSFKLASKIRVGAKVRKTYHAPETPYAKLLACAAISDGDEGPVARGGRPTRPVTAAGGDPLRATPLGRLAAGQTTHLARSPRGKPRRLSQGLGHGVATRRGPRHPSPRAQADA